MTFSATPALERLVLGLVHHTHPPAADPAEDHVIAQPLGRRALVPGFLRSGPIAGDSPDAAGRAAELLQLDQGRDQLADRPGQLWMARDQLASAPAVLRDGTGPETTRRPGRGDHRPGPMRDPPFMSRPPSLRPGRAERISLSRLKARTVALIRRRLAQAQHPRAFAVAELLEMAEDQDLAVDRVHLLEGLLEPLGCARRGWPPRWHGSRGPAAEPPAPPSWPPDKSRRRSRSPGRRPVPWSRAAGDARAATAGASGTSATGTAASASGCRSYSDCRSRASRYASWITSEGSIRPRSRSSSRRATIRRRRSRWADRNWPQSRRSPPIACTGSLSTPPPNRPLPRSLLHGVRLREAGHPGQEKSRKDGFSILVRGRRGSERRPTHP